LRHPFRAFAFGTDDFRFCIFPIPDARRLFSRKSRLASSPMSAQVSKCLRVALYGSLISQRHCAPISIRYSDNRERESRESPRLLRPSPPRRIGTSPRRGPRDDLPTASRPGPPPRTLTFPGWDVSLWGLTATTSQSGSFRSRCGPAPSTPAPDGTFTPAAAGGSLPFTPAHSLRLWVQRGLQP
jgi:hypothetical protein